MRTQLGLYVVAIALSGSALCAPPDDPCVKLVSREVQAAVARDFPSYRLPMQSDNSPEDIARYSADDGVGCLGVALGNFTDSRTSTALLLTRTDADETILVVASRSDSSWRTEVLRELGPGRPGKFVQATPPGKFIRTKALDGPANEPGERLRVVSKRPGVLSGVVERSGVPYFFTVERSGVAYFFTKAGWVHVWVSD